jgi:outer membrane protein
LLSRVWKKKVALLAALIISLPIAADPMGLFEVYQKALIYDGEYQKSQSEHAASMELFYQGRASLLPSLSFEYQTSYTQQKTIQSDTLVFSQGRLKYPGQSYSLSLTQPIYSKEKMVQFSLSKLEVEKAGVTQRLEKIGLMSRVLDRYLLVLVAQDDLVLARKEEASVAKQFDTANTRFKSELGRKADLLEAQARYASVSARTSIAENAFEDSLEGLREVAGPEIVKIRGLTKVKLQRPDEMDLDGWLEMAAAFNLDVASQRISVEIARKQREKERAARSPTVDFVASRVDLDSKGTEFGGGRETETSVVELRLQMPIYQGGQMTSRVRQAGHLYVAAQQELKSRVRLVSRETRSAYKDIEGAIRRINSLEQAVEAQQLYMKTVNAGYPSLYNMLQVLDAEENLFIAERDLNQAKYDYIRGTLRLQIVSSEFGDEDMLQIDQWLVDGDEVKEVLTPSTDIGPKSIKSS